MPTKGTVARGSARIFTGIIALAVAAVAIGGAVLLPLPSVSVTPPSHTVAPVPTSAQRVCPGPLMELGAGTSSASTLASFGRASTTYGAASGGQSASSHPLSAADDSVTSFGAPLLVSVPAEPDTTTPPELAASQTQTAKEDDVTGFAAAACGEASPDSWLVGGSASLGQTTLVMLANPSTVQATVDLTIYGESGKVAATGSTGIIVAPGAQRVIPLAGLAPSVAAPVIHVTTTGGKVLASLQQSYVNGIDPEGVELTGATNAPATKQVISGVAVRTLAAVQATSSSEGWSASLPAVRVLVPGTKAATVTVGATGEKGTAAGNSTAVTVQPGVVTEIPLQNLADGDFTVTVDSTEPVLASARTTTTSGAGTDFAWFTASQALTGSFLIAVAAGSEPTLHLANTGASAASVTLTSSRGVETKTSIPSQSAVGIPLATTGMFTLSGAKDLVASLSYAGNGLISSLAINPPGPLASPIVVYPN